MKRLLVPALLLNAVCLLLRIAQEASPPLVEAQAAGEVILDNGRPGTSFVGSWTKSSAPSPFGTESLYNSIAGNSYTWQLALPASGEYEVYAWWTVLASRAPAAPYVVTHAGGASTVTKDQRANGGKWNLLGKWSFTNSGRVQVRTTANVSTSADAIRFVRGGPPTPTLTLEEKEILSHFSIEHLPAGGYCVDSGYFENCPPPDVLAKTIRVTGVNFQLVNGTDATEELNGLGNLIVGYQESRPFGDGNECFSDQSNKRSGSHNLIVGRDHNYVSSMGIAVGYGNGLGQGPEHIAAASFGIGCFSGVTAAFTGGGHKNAAMADNAAILGGVKNWVFEDNGAITGGAQQRLGQGDCGGE